VWVAKGVKEGKMRIVVRLLTVFTVLVLVLPGQGRAANVESFGMISAGVGAERETGGPSGCTNLGVANEIFSINGGTFKPGSCVGEAGARGMVSILGVLPFAMQDLGLQGGLGYNGGDGSRFGAKLGPVYGWAGGKAGVIVDYQYRSHGSSHFFWLTPAVSLYVSDMMNVNLSYTQPISPIQDRNRRMPNSESSEMFNNWFIRYVPTNRLQGSVSIFPINSLEVNLGAQVNTFAGYTNNLRGAGVGPVFGLAWMPIQNVELNLVKGTIDNRSRYNVQSGLSWFFNTGSTKGNNIKEIRRKYLQTPEPGVAVEGPKSGRPSFTGF
jgi:hypothetical protein